MKLEPRSWALQCRCSAPPWASSSRAAFRVRPSDRCPASPPADGDRVSARRGGRHGLEDDCAAGGRTRGGTDQPRVEGSSTSIDACRLDPGWTRIVRVWPASTLIVKSSVSPVKRSCRSVVGRLVDQAAQRIHRDQWHGQGPGAGVSREVDEEVAPLEPVARLVGRDRPGDRLAVEGDARRCPRNGRLLKRVSV